MGEMNIKKRILVGAAGAVVLVLLAVVAWAQSNQAKKGTTVMAKAAEQLQQAEGWHSNASLVINLPERMRNTRRPLTKVVINLDGDVGRGEQALMAAGDMRVEAKGPGNIFFTEGELRVLEDKTAFKLSEFPVLLNPSGSLSSKWTYVQARLLGIRQDSQALSALRSIGENLTYQGTERIESEQTWHLAGTLSEEASRQVQEAWKVSNSDNKGLDVVARLLAANKVKQMDVWIAKSSDQLRRVRVNFVRPLSNGGEFDFATLEVTLTDYGRAVVVDRPKEELKVDSGVFAKLFGTGEIEEIKAEQ